MSERPGGEAKLEVVLDVSAVPAEPAGAGRYIVELARALARRQELSLSLVSRRGDGTRWAATAPAARLLPLVPRGRPARLAYEATLLARRLRRLGATAEVYHGPHYTMPPGLSCGRVVTVHDLTFFDHPEWHESKKVAFFQAAIRRAARSADVVVCVSRATAARLEALFDVRGEVVVAEHGVDHDRFAPGPPDLSALSSELAGWLGGGDPRHRLVVHVGTLEPRKGVVDLVAAFGTLAATRPELRLVLVGLPGWGAREVNAAVAASPRPEQVLLTGWVSDEAVVALMRAAGAVAYPSREEGFGLPALEAMASGATLVTTAGTAMAEFAGGAAFLSEPGSCASLADALKAALEAPEEERERRRSEGLERAASFTWERTAERHVLAYRLAAEAARRRGGGAPGGAAASR